MEQKRYYYGLAVEQFLTPAAVWHASGAYILVAAAAGHVYVFAVANAKVVTTFKAHDKNVRALSYDSQRNLLYTGSFDRTVRVWGAS